MSLDGSSIVEDHNALPLKHVVCESSFIHTVVEIVLAFSGFEPIDELTFVEGPVLYLVFAVAVGQIVFPLSIVRGAVGKGEDSFEIGLPFVNLSLICDIAVGLE